MYSGWLCLFFDRISLMHHLQHGTLHVSDASSQSEQRSKKPRSRNLTHYLISRPEELSGVWRADGLPLVHDGGVGVEEGRVADVAVAHSPPNVARRPPHVAGTKEIWNFHPLLCFQNTSKHTLLEQDPGRGPNSRNLVQTFHRSTHLIPYTAPIVHLLTTACPPVGCWIPLGSPAHNQWEESIEARISKNVELSLWRAKSLLFPKALWGSSLLYCITVTRAGVEPTFSISSG